VRGQYKTQSQVSPGVYVRADAGEGIPSEYPVAFVIKIAAIIASAAIILLEMLLREGTIAKSLLH
jgi:hypothetical protein